MSQLQKVAELPHRNQTQKELTPPTPARNAFLLFMAETEKAPRITIAICTRNRAAFLEKALQSLIPQMHACDELLLIDNASTDRTPEIAAQAAARDPRIKVYREERLGLSAGRNAAHRLART